MSYREMEVADAMVEDMVAYVKIKYPVFSDLSKSLSEGSWEEWIRNQVEAYIFKYGGKTLSGHQNGTTKTD